MLGWVEKCLHSSRNTLQLTSESYYSNPRLPLTPQGWKFGDTLNFNWPKLHFVHWFQNCAQINQRVGENESWFLIGWESSKKLESARIHLSNSYLSEHNYVISGPNVARGSWNFKCNQIFILVGAGGNRVSLVITWHLVKWTNLDTK